MSSGDQRTHPIRGDEARELMQLAQHPAFQAALKQYSQEDDQHDDPFLAGSDTAGRTVIFDRRFVAAIRSGQVTYDGKPYDPRPFIRVHESVEGVLIRLFGYDYARSHLLATIAERHAVESAGMDWHKYATSLTPWISRLEHAPVANPPPGVLLQPFRGTKFFNVMANNGIQ